MSPDTKTLVRRIALGWAAGNLLSAVLFSFDPFTFAALAAVIFLIIDEPPGTKTRKVDIVINSNQDPERIARLTQQQLDKLPDNGL